MNARTEPQLLSRISSKHLDALEEEAIFILREVAGAFERPTLLFSGGKDSLVLLKCAEKAFGAGRLPYPLLMIDTGHNFPRSPTSATTAPSSWAPSWWCAASRTR